VTDDTTAAAVRALAADVETLGRRLTAVEAAAEKAGESAAGAHRAVVQVVEMIDKSGPADSDEKKTKKPAEVDKPLPPWLVDDNAEDARRDLADLIEWLGAVYLHYHGADLGDCWMWHPGVVAELTALRNGWVAAHYGQRASAAAVMDWHDRFRPGAAARIRRELDDCHLERHTASGDRQYRPARVPGVDLIDDLADWWASTHGSSAAPSPTPAMMASARAAFDARAQY
jgi:hypothetical protein